MAAMVRTVARASSIIGELVYIGMEFKVISACFNNASVWSHSEKDCDFYLEEDGCRLKWASG